MRSYRKAYRTYDFKTIFATPPPGFTITNSGVNATKADELTKVCVRIGSLFQGKPYYVIQLYNRFAPVDHYDGFDADGNVVDTFTGLNLANTFADCQFYSDHPEN